MNMFIRAGTTHTLSTAAPSDQPNSIGCAGWECRTRRPIMSVPLILQEACRLAQSSLKSVRDVIRIVQAGALALLVVTATIQPAHAQGIVAFEFLEKRIKSAESTTPLADNVFGDKISLYNGSTEFEVFDIDLVGNNDLPVRLGRTWKLMADPQYLNANGSSSQVTPLGGFGAWDLSVPYIYGTFDSAFGWNAGGTLNRCSSTTSARVTDNLNPRDMLSGRQLHIPGEGDMDLMILSAAHQRPNDGPIYKWGTKSDYRGRCIQLLNGQGEGFELVDPKGTVYRFDVFAIRDGGIVQKGSPTGPVYGSRQAIYLMASKVTDRHGNYVNYHYVGNGELEKIESSDGRLITTTRSGGRIDTATAGSRTWRYHYSPTFEVENPDQTRWRYEAQGNTVPQISTIHDAHVCDYPIITDPGPYVLTITAPSGLKGKFSFGYTAHRISGTPANWFCIVEYWADWPNPPEPTAMIGTPDFFLNYALFEKEFSGPGMTTKTWTYEYGMPETGKENFGGPYCTWCDRDKPVIVRQPDGTSIVHQFGALWGFNTGELLATYTLDQTGTIVKSEVHEHVTDQDMASMPFPDRFEWGSSDDSAAYRIRPVKLTTVSVGANLLGHPAYERPPGPPPPPPPCWVTGECELPPPCEINPVTGQCDDPTSLPPGTQSGGPSSGDQFRLRVDSFDAFARPTGVTKSSSLGFSKTEATSYANDLSKWVISQVASTTLTASSLPADVPIEISRTDYWSGSALPQRTWAFGKPQQYFTYYADGTLATVTDGNNNTVTLSNWKRGIPQSIQYPATPDQPSGTSRSAFVNNNGWIDWVTDENGYKTCYTHDPMGRLASITHPSETQTGVCNTSAWAATIRTFAPAATAKYGIPAGHWQQTVSTGNARKVTYFDALWRPLVEEAFDNTSTATATATRSVSVKRYDTSGRPAFQSYPLRTLTNYATVTQGHRSFYDALDRPIRAEQDSELGVLATTTDYLSGFKTRVTSPKHQGTGIFTETAYLAWDQPTTDFPTLITHPENAVTQIVRDTFGKPTQLVRSSSIDPAQWKSHYFAYDAHQRLCKRTDVETSTTAMGYDDAGNLTWSATGLSWSPTGACLDPQAAHVVPRRVDRSYDARNRLLNLAFPDGRGDQFWQYTPDGLPQRVHTVNVVGANNIDNTWDYNRRRMLKTEVQQLPAWYTYSLGYTYDGNGSLQRINYPSSDYVDFAPNALGQATQAVGASQQTYASNVTYYPNGAIETFHYGNGLLHHMLQNARQLPSWVAFNNSVGRYEYGYDKNGNITSLIDHTTGQNGRTTRTMGYDGLDRLRMATSPMYPGGALYEYDTLDNLTRVKAPGRDQTYCYTNNRLHFVRNGPSCTSSPAAVALGYDNQGNVAFKNEADYDFDYGNRLREVMGVERYRYDAHGRRILAMQFDNGTVTSQYGSNGQLLYQKNERTGQMKTIDHIYLAGSLIAQREVPIGGGTVTTKYLHTDALGSPVAVTNQSNPLTGIERFEYEPYGKGLIGGPGTVAPKDGPGYTGHVLDAATGLNYMQQRYYDPGIGRFLSVDPVTANGNTGDNFNRYKYANNNPYRFTDPDGRQEREQQRDWSSITARSPGAAAQMATSASPMARSAPLTPVTEKGNYPTNQSNGQELQAANAVGLFDAYAAEKAANRGKAIARQSGLPGDRNGPRDALRHCAAACEVARVLDSASAVLLGDIHEVWFPNAADETQMDMFNNRFGANNSASSQTCGVTCTRALDNGQLEVLPDIRWDKE